MDKINDPLLSVLTTFSDGAAVEPFHMEKIVAEIGNKHGHTKLEKPKVINGAEFHTVEGANSADSYFSNQNYISSIVSYISNTQSTISSNLKINTRVTSEYEFLCIFNLKFACSIPEKHFLRRFPGLIKPIRSF